MQFDCARCEELLLDFAYGELDDVTAAAFRRHADGCARCGASLADVRVVREAFSMMALESPSPAVDARILAAADARLNELDDKKRALQRDESRSVLGKIFDLFRVAALRPQYAMAMVLVLVVGIGLYVAPQMRMTEQAAPGVAPTLVGEAGPELAPLPASPSPPAAAQATPTPTDEVDSDGLADSSIREPSAPDAPSTVTASPTAPAAGDAVAEGAARQDVREGRDAPAQLQRSLRAPADDAFVERTPDRDRELGRQPVVVVPAPARATRGGGGRGLEEEDSGARLGFTQTPELEARRAEEAQRETVARGEQEARSRRQSFAPAPPPAPGPAFARPPASQPPQAAPSANAGVLQQAQGQQAQQALSGVPGGLGAEAGNTEYERGMRNYRAGQYRAAIPDLQTAVGRPGLTNDALATAHLAIARSFMRTGNYAEAVRRYEDLMRRFAGYRSNPEVNFDAAECHRLLGNTTRANELYRVAERSAQYGERARARRVQMDGARRAAPAFDAMEAAEPSPASGSAAH